MQRPAEMLDQMKSQWETIMASQTETMRDLVNQTVTSALEKKKLAPSDDKLGATPAQTKFFEEKIAQSEMELQKKTREIEALRSEKLGVVEAESVKARELHEAQRNQEKTAKELQALIQQSAD